ncbi:MAG TPA: BlaI/MecI/CopY family transcriptional regulator [Candidatus Aquilonibacter sp.]
MKRKRPKPLTKAELRIMEALWRARQATVAEVVAAIGKPPLAYTTVLTMLRILEQKGVVAREAAGRAHVYHPLVERDDAASSAVTDILGAFFADRKTALALQLMAQEHPTDDELDEIRALIARYEENG